MPIRRDDASDHRRARLQTDRERRLVPVGNFDVRPQTFLRLKEQQIARFIGRNASDRELGVVEHLVAGLPDVEAKPRDSRSAKRLAVPIDDAARDRCPGTRTRSCVRATVPSWGLISARALNCHRSQRDQLRRNAAIVRNSSLLPTPGGLAPPRIRLTSFEIDPRKRIAGIAAANGDKARTRHGLEFVRAILAEFRAAGERQVDIIPQTSEERIRSERPILDRSLNRFARALVGHATRDPDSFDQVNLEVERRDPGRIRKHDGNRQISRFRRAGLDPIARRLGTADQLKMSVCAGHGRCLLGLDVDAGHGPARLAVAHDASQECVASLTCVKWA